MKDLHVVVETSDAGKFVRTAPLAYHDALARRDKMPETGRRFSVRSATDPEVSGLFFGPFKTDERAARKVGELRGVAGRPRNFDGGFVGGSGGWLYGPNGRTVAHGWRSYAHLMRRFGRIERGADDRWYALVRPDGNVPR